MQPLISDASRTKAPGFPPGGSSGSKLNLTSAYFFDVLSHEASPSGSPIPREPLPGRIQTLVQPLAQNSGEPIYSSEECKWSDFLSEDFPDILPEPTDGPLAPEAAPPVPPSLSRAARVSAFNPIKSSRVIPQPHMVIHLRMQDPVTQLLHQSRQISPLIFMGLDYVSGPIPFEHADLTDLSIKVLPRRQIAVMATLLLYRYLSILTLQQEAIDVLLSRYHHDKPVVEELVLPALMARGVLMRPPLPRELNKIVTTLQGTSLELATNLVNQFGVVEGWAADKHRLLLLTPLYLPFDPLGVLHLSIYPSERGRVCRIGTLKILFPQEKFRGYGTLLLSYAFQIAQLEQCSALIVEATPENLSFCLLMGFRPLTSHSSEIWRSLDFAQKFHISQEMCMRGFTTFSLHLNDPAEEMERRRDVALNPYYRSRTAASASALF